MGKMGVWEFRFKLNTKTQRHEDSKVIIKKTVENFVPLCLCVPFNSEEGRKTSGKKNPPATECSVTGGFLMVG